jgi:hypothetical protein
MFENKIVEFLKNEHDGVKILSLLSATAVLRKERPFRIILSISKKKKLLKPVKVYETLLQTYLFAGFPSALISLKIASEYFSPPRKQKIYSEDINKIGVANCRKIYGNKVEKLIENIKSFSPELSEMVYS